MPGPKAALARAAAASVPVPIVPAPEVRVPDPLRSEVQVAALALLGQLAEVGDWCVAMRVALMDLRAAAVRPSGLHTICAWCLRVMQDGDPRLGVTHGICDRCEARLR